MPREEQPNLREKVRTLPSGPGVYLMRDRLGRILYVGKAINLRKRVSSYFRPSGRQRIAQPKVRAMIALVHDVDIIEVRSETEALLLEGRLIKEEKPKYNTEFTDDKRFLMVKVDLHTTFPRFRFTRNRIDDGARYFGPYPHSGLLRRTLGEMQRKFGILTGDAHPVANGDGTYRLYDDARAEIYGQNEAITESEYQQRVAQAMQFLDGKSREWLADLTEEMRQAATDRNYERAAWLRDSIKALKRTLSPSRRFTRKALSPQSDASALQELQDQLGLPSLPHCIECFDISHVSGTFCVASMVRFTNGKPDRKRYRHFRIRSFIGNDDFRAMHEVVGRRYKRVVSESGTLPDLVVIDGGRGQVNAALRAFSDHDIPCPALIGLAKREETIIRAAHKEPLQLPRHAPALQLLQHLRDEAHRFANAFNADLRSRRLKESVLDDFPGLGEKRKQLLLEHFRTLTNLRGATAEAIAEVPGIGLYTARRLHEYLDSEQRNREKVRKMF